MTNTWNRLQRAFVDDHRTLTREYKVILECLAKREFQAASRAADDLDQSAGPHIEFEERFLYPQVERVRGSNYTSRLYLEHDSVVAVLRELADISPDQELSELDIQRWKSGLQHGVDHASACGSMLSQLKTLPESEQLRLLDGLTRLHEKKSRWSELSHPKQSGQ